MDDFKGRDPIILQPGDSSVPFTFTFAASTSATANTGSIPFGTLLSTVTQGVVEAFDESGSTVTASIVEGASNSSLVQTVTLNYPATSGRYSLEMLMTLDNGAVMEFDFTRVYAMDISAKR